MTIRINSLLTKRKINGFTLVELLVVIAVIAIIAGFVLTNLATNKSKTRDSVRVNNIKTFRDALALYQINRGLYPIYDGYINGSDPASRALLNEIALKTIPMDPINKIANQTDYRYYYKSTDGSTYILKFCLETNTIQGYNKGCNNEVKP